MIIFVVGGAKSSKSSIGELLASKLSNNGRLYYLATMNPYDEDDNKRIEAHIKNRKEYGFKTIEHKRDLHQILKKFNDDDTVLIDSITSLLTNEMFEEADINEDVSNKITKDIIELANKVHNLIMVSDYVFSDGIIYDKYTEIFRQELGDVNCNIAAVSDVVIESSFGSLIFHKGIERIKDEKLI